MFSFKGFRNSPYLLSQKGRTEFQKNIVKYFGPIGKPKKQGGQNQKVTFQLRFILVKGQRDSFVSATGASIAS